MRIAVCQMTSGLDPVVNTQFLVDAIATAAADGAGMLFTPEMSTLIDRDRERSARSIVDEADDAALAAVRQAARRSGIWVHLGSIAVRAPDGRRANRGFVIDSAGTIRARYDKMHLFDAAPSAGDQWRESATYVAGGEAVAVDVPCGRLGLSICYDLRFPDLYRALSDAGATALAVPAAFTQPTGAAHWHILLRARAIEAAAYVIAAAQTGVHGDGRATYGHSLVVDPWGEVVLDMGEAAGIGYADIDPDRVVAARRRVPVMDHRRVIPPVRLA